MLQTYFFDKINNCSRRDFAEQLGQCRACKILLSDKVKINTIQKNVFHSQKQAMHYSVGFTVCRAVHARPSKKCQASMKLSENYGFNNSNNMEAPTSLIRMFRVSYDSSVQFRNLHLISVNSCQLKHFPTGNERPELIQSE